MTNVPEMADVGVRTCLRGCKSSGTNPTPPKALAQSTTRLRLGTLVTGIHYRHPAVLANMAAALDVISNGRLELGIGAGWNEEESGAYGIELGSIKEH
jgi:alkanesulfonate monooxygenase SsuD/methylene tetrahydromethanopterin reductase-like flavin-dependent oxidoreductase (luciferase family)